MNKNIELPEIDYRCNVTDSLPLSLLRKVRLYKINRSGILIAALKTEIARIESELGEEEI